jgi:ADP-heptose:LPS heptosyltransferase
MPSVPARILILKPSSLGDVVHTLPAVAAIRAHWPKSEIAWLINPEWAPLLAGNKDINRIIEFPRRQFRGPRGWLKIPAWLASLGGWTPDLALDFQGLLRTALIARFLGSKTIIGLSDAREGAGFFYHRTARLPREPLHSVDRYLRLLRELDLGDVQKPTFPLPSGDRPNTDVPDEFLLLHPFSRGQGKSMEIVDVVRLCQELHPRKVVLVGGPRAVETLPGNVTNLLGKTTLAELIWLIRRAKFTVSVDSGPMHIAAAITSRLLSIHTWSDPLLVGPYNGDAWIWKNAAICQTKSYQPGSTQNTQAPIPSAIADFITTHVR